MAEKHTHRIKVIVTGGGTGGHLFPGIAVAEAILKRFPEGEVLFVGTDRQVDTTALAGRPFKTATIRCQGLKGKSLLSWLRTMIQLPLSVVEAMKVIRRFKPDLVFGVGGYVTGPVVLAARLMGIAACIHEQNSIPGITNRILGKLANKVFISIPGSERFFSKEKSVLTGNPVRGELLALAAQDAPENTKGGTLLVLGGSQGAHRVNTLVSSALCGLDSLPENFMVIHQTGVRDEAWVTEMYAKKGIKARVGAFFQDMAEIYRQADLVVSRAGATTLAEIGVLKKPAILIPYPYAADDHQKENGRYLAEGGAAIMYLEGQLDERKLADGISDLLNNRDRRRKMAGAMARLARPQATETIVDACLHLITEKRQRV